MQERRSKSSTNQTEGNNADPRDPAQPDETIDGESLPPGPLAGVRVLDLTHVLAGSYCSALLADMGADVVKIERPNGDEARGPNAAADGFGPANRNKRSLIVDFSDQDGVDLLTELATKADVLVENYRPGSLSARGLGYEQLGAVNPKLVYCTISGFGRTGPDAERGGFDLVAQGIAGLMSITGEPGGPPVKVGVPISDLNAGVFAALGVVGALHQRSATGRGQYIETSLLEGALAYTVWESALYFASGIAPGPLGSSHRLTAPYEAFPTSDGWINVGAANQSTWERFARELGIERMTDDPRFASGPERLAHRDELAEVLSPILAGDTTDNWLARLETAGVPCGPVYDLEQTWSDPQVLARQMVVEAPTPTGTGRFIGPAVKSTVAPWAIRRGVPTPGGDTTTVLAEYGLDSDQIDRLIERGVVQQFAANESNETERATR